MNKHFQFLKDWLEKCNKLRKLDFNPNIEIKSKLRRVKHYNPISIKKMKDDKTGHRRAQWNRAVVAATRRVQNILDSSCNAKRTIWMMAIGVSIIEFSFKFFQFQAGIGLIHRQIFSSPLYLLVIFIHTKPAMRVRT